MAYRAEFAAAVREAIAGRSYRQIAPKAGVSASYIADMVQGHIPVREKVISFANATGYDENTLLEAAGYEPNEEPAEAVLLRELAALSAEVGPLAIDFNDARFKGLTPDQARATVEDLRRQKKAGLI